ncbi:sugar kinase [Vibrio cionasavignyae]|uniref:sugar kinase n=1 Tax=Vibrio cionasavignyae TaxID=2910252 RepID=UPI003D0BA942
MKIAFFGECMVELSGEPLRKTFGGDTLNTALYLARLGQRRGIQVSYATGLGDDQLSSDMKSHWQDEQIETNLVETIVGKQPGLYLVETDASGERTFLYWRENSAARHYFSLVATKLEIALATNQFDAFYVSGISIAILDDSARERLLSAITSFKSRGGKVIFDNNFRPQLWSTAEAKHWYQAILPHVDIALMTEDDDVMIWGNEELVESRCQRLGVSELVIKRGHEPCKVVADLQSDVPTASYVAATLVANVVDTCAAGDSFAAGYLAARLTGESGDDAALLGHKLASTVIQHPGAVIPLGAMDHLI